MSDKSGIEWTEATWNCITGCTKVSQGCKHCYAEREWPRLAAPRAKPNIYTGRAFTDVKCHPEKLDIPLRWTKPRRIFVNSMSDLFHESVPDEFIAKVFAVMARSSHHIFQVLTKRPGRMQTLLSSDLFIGAIIEASQSVETCAMEWLPFWPLPNVWLGVSVEDQSSADERIPLLLKTPAAVRWISAEPLIEPVTIFSLDGPVDVHEGSASPLHWIVVGGESGPKARPFVLGWGKDIVRQCQDAGVPVFVKQVGSYPTNREGERCPHIHDKKGGDPSEWPKELRVREYPV